MKSKSEAYFQSELRDMPPFDRWPFRRIRAHQSRWLLRDFSVCVCLIVIDGRSNHVSEIHVIKNDSCVRQLSRKGTRIHRLVFSVVLPAYRNYRASDVISLISAAKTTTERIKIGVQFAQERCLSFENKSID